MISITAAICCSFCLAFLLTPFCRNFARAHGLVDIPDNSRKLHAHPIPRIGGVPIVISSVLTITLLMFVHTAGGDRVSQALPLIVRFLPAVAIMFSVGLCDDLIGLKPWQKLAGQLAAASLASLSGMDMRPFEALHINPMLTIPLTIFWLLACTNAFNLIDGVDGLATGVGLFAGITTLTAALLQGNFPLAIATAPLVGALSGFLFFNFNPASIFLGDSGSLTVGFLLGIYGIVWSYKSATMIGITAPIMALSIPLLDTGVAVIRRMLRGRPIFSADRGHIHHRLLDRGHSTRRVVLILYAVSAVGAVLSLLMNVMHGHLAGLVLLVFCGAASIGIQHVGFVEFNCLGALIRKGSFQRAVDAQVELRAIEQNLSAAHTLDDCWLAVRRASAQLGFDRITMRVGETVYEESVADGTGHRCWTIDIPLSSRGFVKLAHPFNRPRAAAVVEAFADLLLHVLDRKILAIQSSGESLELGVKASAPLLTFKANA
jgi:UDP-GlcNAc:undecaprenyl-phosphate/decaprenyl-phosphate GlcNAc-1-phosphate transferase